MALVLLDGIEWEREIEFYVSNILYRLNAINIDT